MTSFSLYLHDGDGVWRVDARVPAGTAGRPDGASRREAASTAARLQRTPRLAAPGSCTGTRRGPVLAGGIAYAALFSVFGAVVAGFSVFGLVLGSNGPLFDEVVRRRRRQLPGLLDVPAGDGVIEPGLAGRPGPGQLRPARSRSSPRVFAGLGWLDALREGVRAMFGHAAGAAATS